MSIRKPALAAFAAVAFTASGTAALAQNAADPAMTGVPMEEDRDDDSGKWGLLGLLGLAGLLGMKRRDRDDDLRRDTRTGTNR
jgi:MYXO-CTERM domain-containing protein